MKDILIINSYGGSLMLGAQATGYPIRGSYEDSGFGIEAQKLNFPKEVYVDKLPWPKDDLSETVVIAHPPCAPFSIMNPMKGDSSRAGTSAEGFKCHRDVMDYALGQGALSLAIESVPGVLKVAEEYETMADKYGYNVYYLKLNAISFGVPQWRPRVWIIFIRQPARKLTHLEPQKLKVAWEPKYRKLSECLVSEGTLMNRGDEKHIILRRLQEAKVDPSLLRKIFEGEYGEGTLLQIGTKVLEVSGADNFQEVRKAWNLGGLFAAMMPRVLNPEGWAPTILGGSAWFVNGRPLLLEEYNNIMGFPTDYKWPANFSDPRLYLSKGVCPPIATWILQQMEHNILHHEFIGNYSCAPKELLDLCPKKETVEKALRGESNDPIVHRVKKARKASEPEAPVERVRVSASELGKSFLDSLGSDE